VGVGETRCEIRTPYQRGGGGGYKRNGAENGPWLAAVRAGAGARHKLMLKVATGDGGWSTRSYGPRQIEVLNSRPRYLGDWR
jgi:hypothetical protein